MGTNSSNNKRIAKNTAFLYIRMVFVLFVSLYSTRAILNVLGVVDYGIYNVVAGFVSMFAFLNSSMTNTIQRFFNYEKGKNDGANLNEVFVTSAQIQLILAIVTFAVLEVVGVWYINNKMVLPENRLTAAMWVFQFSVSSLFLLIIQIPYAAAVVAHERMGFYAIVSVIDAILKLAVALALPFFTYDKLVVYGVLMLIISIANLLLFFIYARKNFSEIRFVKSFNKPLFKNMLSFSGWNVFGSFAYTMQGQGLNVLMNAFFGPIVNAARGVAYQVQSALSGFTENVAVAFKPQLVESHARGANERTISLMYSMSKLGYLMVFILSIPISIEINYILTLWLGDTVPEYTSLFTILVLANMALGSLNMPISQTVQAVGQIKNYQTARSVVVVSVLPISWLALALGASAYSVFIVLVLINFLNQPLSMFLLHKIFDYSYSDYIKKVILPCFSFSVISPIVPLAIHYFMNESFVRLSVVVFTSVVCSILCAYLTVLSSNERYFVKSIISKFFNKK